MVKDHANTTEPRLPWAGKQVHALDVESELSHLWRMSADNVRISQNTNVRTSVLNFVICAPDIASARQASMLLRDLSSTHIARVILLILNTDSTPANISTWVTLRSFPIISDIMRHSFEQITMLATGDAIRQADHAVQALLKNDLPVYLWWLHDPPKEGSILLRLGELCHRVIVDSSSFATPEQSIRALSSLVHSAPNCSISDLNWARIAPWRELIAQFFDVTEYKPYLSGVNRIDIEHSTSSSYATQNGIARGVTSPNPVQALLLTAWLKTRLGWQHIEASDADAYDQVSGAYDWHMSRTTGALASMKSKSGKLSTATSVHIALRPRDCAGLLPGSICLTHLESIRDGKHASFIVNREDDWHVITSVKLEEGIRPRRAVSIGASQKVSDLLHNEMEIMSRDELYEEILHEVFDLLAP
ncbi:MAG TPA: glucose-6-phosphate dehydrogenase assembly protein OpcA [Ktedonobacteraceae bacterium]|nr:glucose-6-phosphate dehydrogenase assembly protein OpcA [Ktedonobacteraceae bacterium]